MDAQFEHLCRICAANTKSKNNSVVESVFIFKTTGLKDKIDRHLYLNVSENDPFPKVLCKTCYRQVEATASLSNIAKHTQRVFQDFLLSTVPKQSCQTTAPVNIQVSVGTKESRETCESNHSLSNTNTSLEDNVFQPIFLTRPPESTIERATNINKAKDIEMRQQQKRHRETTEYTINRSNIKTSKQTQPTRRNSVFLDTRYSSAPMSIAQRSMQLAPVNSEGALSKATKLSPEIRNSPAGVINFIQTHGRVTGSAPTGHTTKNCKGFSVGSNVSIYAKKEETSASPLAVSNAGVPNLSTSVIQQKRRNLKNALSNISAIRDGQISLLKSAHQRKPVEDNDIRPPVTTTVVPHQSLYGVESSVEEALPEHIIIAAPKKKRDELVVSAPQGSPMVQHVGASPCENLLLNEMRPTSQNKNLPNMSGFTESISLGNVIRDPDLLKLILKALKWPITTGNCDEQMAKLKSSKFAVIMSDSNLLQDNDLTQLLGPYLGPTMAIAQQQHKNTCRSKSTSSPPVSPLATSELHTIGDCTMPYKLPPETSVQLVPSSPSDQEQLQPTMKTDESNVKRLQRKCRVRDLTSSGDVESSPNAALVANELFNMNAMLLTQFSKNPADALNEALTSMIKQQQEAKLQRPPRRRRSGSPTTNLLNLEDIVLVEPQPLVENPLALSSDISDLATQLHEVSEPPTVTRPIIKRRKANLQTSKINDAKPISNTEISLPIAEDSSKIGPSKDNHMDDITSPDDYCKVINNTSVQGTADTLQAPTSTVSEVISSYETNKVSEAEKDTADNFDTKNKPKKPTLGNFRKTTVKSALGQKLLEAIGLPQPGKDTRTESSRDSLRSALKRSLKQAQEQQQQLKRVKQEEPVKQMADSTTKLVAGESSEEHKKAIAERELELLKRKTKISEKNSLSIKDEKSDRSDVSSSSSRNRKMRSRPKNEAHDDDSAVEERKNERWDEDDNLPLKMEPEKNTEFVNRPTRTSKTMSKYYKSPGVDKSLEIQKTQHAMGRRSTRQRSIV